MLLKSADETEVFVCRDRFVRGHQTPFEGVSESMTDLPQWEILILMSQHSQVLVGLLGVSPSGSCGYQDGRTHRTRNVPPAICHF